MSEYPMEIEILYAQMHDALEHLMMTIPDDIPQHDKIIEILVNASDLLFELTITD
jgi:hypothetical protein